MMQTHVPNLLDDKIRGTVQLITYTVLQNCLSLFTIHQNSQFTSKTLSICQIKLRGWAFTFFLLRIIDWVRSDWVPVVVFTTYWKFQCCCIHCLFGFNECQWLVYTHTFPFIPNQCYLMISNTCIMFLLTQWTIHEYKTGNDVSEFIHSNCITLSYSSPKHKSLIPKYLIHLFHFCTQ